MRVSSSSLPLFPAALPQLVRFGTRRVAVVAAVAVVQPTDRGVTQRHRIGQTSLNVVATSKQITIVITELGRTVQDQQNCTKCRWIVARRMEYPLLDVFSAAYSSATALRLDNRISQEAIMSNGRGRLWLKENWPGGSIKTIINGSMFHTPPTITVLACSCFKVRLLFTLCNQSVHRCWPYVWTLDTP